MNLLLFFQQFSTWFKILLGELLNNLISLFFILAVYFALWHFPQTVDLLLILNQADAFLFEVPLYFFLLIASAFLIWNAPKYFYFHNYKDITFFNLIGFVPNQHYKFQSSEKTIRYSYRARVHMRKVVPRMLAILLLIISALSILHAMELFELENVYTNSLNPANTLIFFIFFLLLLSEPILYNKIQETVNQIPRINILLFTLSLSLIILIVTLGILNTQTEEDLGNLFLSNCALVVLFFTVSFNSYRFLKELPTRVFYGIILVIGFALLFCFLVLNFITEWASYINPLSVLILSLISLFMISFLLILMGKKLKLPLFSITCIVCLFSSRFLSETSDHYQLNLEPSEVTRISMDAYMYEWIKSRKDLIENEEQQFPVILVSAEGGGSRAGLWSFLVHSYLYDKSDGKYFKENLLSLTGASGGSVGNTMFFAEAQYASQKKTKADFKITSKTGFSGLKYKASAIYKENYLSTALISLLGRDLFKEITGLLNFKNRGELLEDQWINAHEEYFRKPNKINVLENEFLSFYQGMNDVSGDTVNRVVPPLLFINTTHTQTGNYNVVSPVRYSHLHPLKGMNDFIDDLQKSYPNTSISIATAMRINASFPYITPVGEVRKVSDQGKLYSDQYADAGYYDNIGGVVSKGVEEVFKKIVQDSFPLLQHKISIKHLIIANDEEQKIVKTQTQFAAPLTTLQNVRYGHTQESVKRLGSIFAIKLKPTTISLLPSTLSYEETKEEILFIKPVLPLGRYLSTVAIRSVEARLQEVSSELDSILQLN